MLYYSLGSFSSQQNILFAGEIILQKKWKECQKTLQKCWLTSKYWEKKNWQEPLFIFNFKVKNEYPTKSNGLSSVYLNILVNSYQKDLGK